LNFRNPAQEKINSTEQSLSCPVFNGDQFGLSIDALLLRLI
jgi:hypothetical protein